MLWKSVRVWIVTVVILMISFFILKDSKGATTPVANTWGWPGIDPSLEWLQYAQLAGNNVSEPTRTTCYGIEWRNLYHAGQDYKADAGDLVYSVADGVVVEVIKKDFPGAVVIVEHTTSNNDKVYSLYGHLKKVDEPNQVQPQVTKGQEVYKDQTVIGKVYDDDSRSHLHLEIRTMADASTLCGYVVETFWEGNGYTPVNPDFPYNANNIGSNVFDPNHDGYTDPYKFINNMRLTDQIKLFPKTFFRGDELTVSGDIGSVFNLPFGPNQFGSIALPDGPDASISRSAIVFKSSDGQGPQKQYAFSDIDARNDTLSDGSQVLNNISSVKSSLGVCLQPSGNVNAAVANDCVPPNATPSPQPTQSPIDGIQVVSPLGHEVSPGEGFNPSITIKVTSGQLGILDYLHAIPGDNSNTLGAHSTQGVHHVVSTGNTYTFQVDTHPEFHMIAPQQTGTYQSVWRMHVNGQDVGPEIVIPITVRTVNETHPIDYWDAYYYTSKDLSGSASHHTTLSDLYLFKDWGIGSPNSSIPVDNWSAKFVREINFPGGDYHFHCQHDDGCRILIDGTTRLDAWWDSSFAGHDWTGTLSPGYHEVKVQYYDQGGDARLDVWWQGPGFLPRYPSCEPDQWCGEYWGNKTLSGVPPLTRREGTGMLNIGWGTGSPGHDLPNDNFSARFTRTIPFACGSYRFHVKADDGERFFIDSALILDEWIDRGHYTTDVDVQLTEGDHTLRIDYYEDTGHASTRIDWDQLTTCAPTAGNLVVSSGQTVLAATTQTQVTASATAATVESSEGFAVGDQVLFHQTQGTANAGKWEMAQIVTINGSSWTLDHALTHTYDRSSGRGQAIKVPRYASVTVQSGGTLTAPPWNGSTGGILVFESDGNVTIDGTLDMAGKGFRGGSGSKRTLNHTGAQGESYTGPGTTCSSNGCNVKANNGGGGGSGGIFASGSGSGAGAGYGTSGAQAPTGGAIPGSTYGDAVFDAIFLGSGGGGGYEDGNGAIAGNGGNGGGIIFINAPNITVNGSVVADGTTGQNSSSLAGGSGSGGSIYLNASSSLAIGTNKVSVHGRAGGVNTSGWSGGNGGASGVGRVWIEYCDTLSGSTDPVANVQQLNCITPTPTATPTMTPTPTAPPTATSSPTATNTPAPTSTSTSAPTSTTAPSLTPLPTATNTLTPIEVIPSDNGILQESFETGVSGWHVEAGATSLTQSPDYASEGINSAQIETNGGWGYIETVDDLNTDWSQFEQLEVHVVNPSPQVVDVRLMLKTGNAWEWNASELQSIPAGSAVLVTFDLSGGWITNPDSIRKFGLIIEYTGSTTQLYIDNIRLIAPEITPTPTPTPVDAGVELLTQPWHLEGNNGAAELYQSIDSTILQGKTMLRITYNLHGLQALGGDASAIIFDQNGWQFVSLSDYGQNGLDGVQTVEISLSDFAGLNSNESVGTLHTRFWYGGPFVVDISSIVAYSEVTAARAKPPAYESYLPLIHR